MHKLGAIMNSNQLELNRLLTSHCSEPENFVSNGHDPTLWVDNPIIASVSFPELMMYLDLVYYLPDDILEKLDRAAMGASLETRIPFLNERVVDFAWSLPSKMKLRNGQAKWILRQVLYKHVPRALVDRPKTGFNVPIGPWLRGPLRDWAEALLDPVRLRERGFLNEKLVQQKWEEHRSGSSGSEHLIWNVLMFEAWLSDSATQRTAGYELAGA